jgi:hypothetical protein
VRWRFLIRALRVAPPLRHLRSCRCGTASARARVSRPSTSCRLIWPTTTIFKRATEWQVANEAAAVCVSARVLSLPHAHRAGVDGAAEPGERLPAAQ